MWSQRMEKSCLLRGRDLFQRPVEGGGGENALTKTESKKGKTGNSGEKARVVGGVIARGLGRLPAQFGAMNFLRRDQNPARRNWGAIKEALHAKNIARRQETGVSAVGWAQDCNRRKKVVTKGEEGVEIIGKEKSPTVSRVDGYAVNLVFRGV